MGWQKDSPLLHVLAQYSPSIGSNHLQLGISLILCPLSCDCRPALAFPLLVQPFTHHMCPCTEDTNLLAQDQALYAWPACSTVHTSTA